MFQKKGTEAGSEDEEDSCEVNIQLSCVAPYEHSGAAIPLEQDEQNSLSNCHGCTLLWLRVSVIVP